MGKEVLDAPTHVRGGGVPGSHGPSGEAEEAVDLLPGPEVRAGVGTRSRRSRRRAYVWFAGCLPPAGCRQPQVPVRFTLLPDADEPVGA